MPIISDSREEKEATGEKAPKKPLPKLPVCEADYQNLRKSGLTRETILANGLRTEDDPVELATILNRLPERPPKQIPEFLRHGGLVIPYFDLQESNGFYRVRPHRPRILDGEPVKYEQPAGEPCRAYFPKASRTMLRDGENEVHITEGEKKALRLSQMGLLAIGLGGIWCWKKKGTDELIDDLAAINWTGRTVYVTFDWDEKSATRRNTLLAAQRFARALRGVGAKEVYRVELPPGPNGDKVGVDDFIVANGEEAFYKLVEQAEPVTKAEGPAVPRATKPHQPIPPYRNFPLKALPEPLRGYVRAAADAIGCDPALVGVPLLPVLGAAVGNSRRIELKKGWTEPAVIWATPVCASGTLKSPGLDAAVAPVRQRQDAAVRDWEAALEAYRQEGGEGEAPVCNRYLVSDTTVEALALCLQENRRGLLLARDELNGWLGSMDAYKSGKGGDLAHYLEMHRAGQLIMDRKTGPKMLIHVPRAALCIVGTTQPETFRRALGREHFEDGLLPRFLPVMPPRRARVWTEETIAEDVAKDFAEVIDRLYSLRPSPTGDGYEPIVLTLSPEAKEVWVAFYNEHGSEQADLDGDLAAAWSKLEGYCARLALLIELARYAANPRAPKIQARNLAERLAVGSGPLTISARSVEAAVELVQWFGYEARRIYALFGDEDEDRELHRLTDWIRHRGGTVTARELQQTGNRVYRGRAEEAEAALERLAAAGVGEWVSVEPSAKGGRPTRRLQLLPATEPA